MRSLLANFSMEYGRTSRRFRCLLPLAQSVLLLDRRFPVYMELSLHRGRSPHRRLLRKNLSSTQIKMAIAGMYVPCMILACPCFTYVNYKNGRCALGSFMSPDMHYNINYWGSIIDLFLDYVCPVALFVILYGRIVLQLHRHRNAIKSNVQSEALTVSAIRVTKCAIAVTAIFIVSMSFHSIYYCFGSVGVISFDFRGPMHLFGILMTLVNSFANPFLYAIFMPAFRRSIRATICRRRNEVQDEGTLDTPGNTA